jgi:hypothetical protein
MLKPILLKKFQCLFIETAVIEISRKMTERTNSIAFEFISLPWRKNPLESFATTEGCFL